MSSRYRLSKKNNIRLRLSAARKANKGQNLAAWRQRKKELAAENEAVLSDVVQEAPSVEQNLSSVQEAPSVVQNLSSVQQTSVQTFSEHSNDLSNFMKQMLPQDANITDINSPKLKDINSSQISQSSVAVESSTTVQQPSSKHPIDPVPKTPHDANIIEIIPGVLQDTNSSRIPIPFVALEKCNVTQTVSNNDSCTPPLVELSTDQEKVINTTTIKQEIHSDNEDLTNSITNEIPNSDTNTLPVISKYCSVSLPKISSDDCSSSSSPAREFNKRLMIPKDPPSILPLVSTAVKDTNPKQRVLRSYCVNTVATQINLDTLRAPKKSKRRKIKKLGLLPKEDPVQGRRIVDFQYLLKALKSVNNHSQDGSDRNKIGCNLNNVIVTKERKCGICTSFYLKCTVCNFQRVIWSECQSSVKKDLNTDFVTGILKINCSFQDANVLLAEMQLPTLSHAYFVEEYEKLCNTASNVGNNRTNQNVSENLGENVQTEPQLPDMLQCSSTSDNSNFLEHVDLGGLLVEDEFEVNEEDPVEKENVIVPDQTGTTSNDELITCQEQVMVNTTTVKQEINSDDEQTILKTVLPQKEAGENRMIVNYEIKQEIHSDDDLTSISSVTNEIPNKDCVIENDGQTVPRTNLSQQEERMFVNQEKANFHNNVTFDKDNILVKSEINDMKITDKQSTSDFGNGPESESPLKKKARTETYEELNKPVDTQGIMTTDPSTTINFFQKRCVSNRLVTATSSTSGRNATMTLTTNMEDGTTSSSLITEGGGNSTFIPVQHMPKSNGNDALVVPQMPHSIASGSYQGAPFIPGTSTAVQQHAVQSNSGLLPLINMHQSWANNFGTPVNNPLIFFPGNSGTAYMPGVATTCQFTKPISSIAVPQPTNLTNAVPNASAATYVPLAPTILQQSVNSSISMPGILPAAIHQPTSLSYVVPSASGATYGPLMPTAVQQPVNLSAEPPMNTDGSRWIGRENINSNNPFCTLPGGAPKGASDPALPKSDSDKSSQQSKRPRFRCDDCDVSFAKHESWDSHKNNYCIKRLKLPPSSTVTNHTSMNDPSPPSHANQSFIPHIEELLSAMAIRRSFLEASKKTALDAQYVINLHKSVQDLTRKCFKELDNALNREKALMPEASLEEQQIVSEARTQALIRAEAAYKQEKHSAAAVEQALYRQKTAIEATLAATGHEQTALISTLKGLKVQANQNNMSSIYQTPCDKPNFKKEKLVSNSFAQSAGQQQVADSVSSKPVSVHKTSLVSSDFFVEHKDEIGALHASGLKDEIGALYASGLQNTSHFDAPSENLSTMNFEESKTVTSEILRNDSPQCKEINATISYTSNNTPSFQNYQPHDYFHPQKVQSLNVATSAETSSTRKYEKENISHDYTHLQELRDFNERLFSENAYVTIYKADKSFTQRVKPDEMMDINIAPSSENTYVLNSDIRPSSESHNFVHKERNPNVNDSSCSLTKDIKKHISLSAIEKETSYTHHS